MRSPVSILPAALKAVEALEPGIRRRIEARMRALGEDARPPDVKVLHAAEQIYRVRVGDYRIVYRISKSPPGVVIVRVGHRREVYRGK